MINKIIAQKDFIGGWSIDMRQLQDICAELNARHGLDLCPDEMENIIMGLSDLNYISVPKTVKINYQNNLEKDKQEQAANYEPF